jgi:heat shock protein HslJ
MKKFVILVLAILLIGGFLFYKFKNTNVSEKVSSYKDINYIIDGQNIKLVNGVSEVEATPGSASKVVTKYFGNEYKGDIDGDSREDVVFLITQESGGSGTFFYVVAALNTVNGYVGSDGYLLGDRIAPQNTGISMNPNHKNVVVVNYADRAPGESMTTRPSIGKSAYLKIDPGTYRWGIVEANFEGEADPSKMNLGMKTWTWVSTTYSDGKEIKPSSTKPFTLTFKSDKTFSAKTDCNGVGGNYTLNKNQISFSNMISTLMYCDGSKEADFTKMLGQVDSYFFTSKGELVFDLKFDTGSSVFK